MRDREERKARDEMRGERPRAWSSVRIVVMYAVFASTWIVASDELSRATTVDPDLLTLVAVLKGILFVIVTSALLFVLIQRYFDRIENAYRQTQKSRDQLQRSLQSTVEVLGKVTEIRDPYTAGHQRRVRDIAVAIADTLGMPEAEVRDIGTAGAVHDIGKISVPAEILTKPGSLSRLELELIRAHSRAGYEILAEAQMPEQIAELVLQHHERCDGSGYPRGLSGPEILKGAKVLMVADVVEAISSDRPYRAARGLDAARAEIEQGSGTIYDAEVCRALLDLLSREPALLSEA